MENYENIWYISKYAVPDFFKKPTRQFFFSKYMAKRGHDVKLVSSRSCGIANIESFGFKNNKSYYVDNLECVVINGPLVNLGFSLKRIFSWLIFEIRLLYWALIKNTKRPTVIIVSSLSLFTILSGILLKKRFKTKLIFEIRDIWPLTLMETKGLTKRNLIIKVFSFIEKLGYKHANAIVGTMPNLRAHVNKISPQNASKVECVTMGYDPDFWNEEGELPVEVKNIFPKDDTFIVTYTGTIGIVNCVDLIISSASILQDKNILFLILGDGAYRRDLENRVLQEKINNVIFINPIEKKLVPKFLRKCHLLLHPIKGGSVIYQYGVSPNKWVDYMYSGRPILSPYDGFQSMINEAECGKFIKPDDPKLLASEILQFSRYDRTILSEMGARGELFVKKHMSYPTLAEKYLNIISKA